MMKKRRNPEHLLTVLFLGILFSIGFVNLKAVIPTIKEKISSDTSYLSSGGTNLEEDYRLAFWNRRDWINSYGVTQKLLGRRIIGNVDFALAENGVLDRSAREEDVLPFAQELGELKDRLDEQNIPLLYIQMPPREPAQDRNPEQLFQTRTYYGQINDAIKDKQITCLDEQEILIGDGHPDLQDFYFKTDIHTTTKGEIWMTNKISEKLRQSFGIAIPQVISETDSNWKKHSHPFLGNFAQSIGEYYIGTDTFEEYLPSFSTHLKVKDVWENWEAEGSFEEVLMNNYDKLADDETYTYWITNYLRYGQGGYHIENSSSDGPRLLFICDSLCYRTLSYLSLGCSRITILDPRFYPENADDPVEKVLSESSYDAVIYLHGTFFTTDYSMFGRGAFSQSEEASGMPGK